MNTRGRAWNRSQPSQRLPDNDNIVIEVQGNANDKIVTGLYEDVESLTVSVVRHVFWEIEKETVDKKVNVTKNHEFANIQYEYDVFMLSWLITPLVKREIYVEVLPPYNIA